MWALALYPALLAVFFEPTLSLWAVTRFWEGHVVVWGHCGRTLNLVLDLAREGQRVVYIGQCPMPPAQRPSGVVFVEGSDDRAALLGQAGLARASHLVALNDTYSAPARP